MALALIVFDCDGILLESVDAKTRAFGQVAEPFGEEARDRLVLYHRLHGGVSRREKFAWLYREVLGREITPAEMESLCERFVTAALENVLNAPLVPGIMDVLTTWKGRVPLYVCSGTPQEELRMVLEQRGLISFFSDVRGTPPAKPELLKQIVREARVDPADVVMIGDSGTDQLAAEAVETLFYGRGREFEGSGYPWGDELTGLNAWLETQSRKV